MVVLYVGEKNLLMDGVKEMVTSVIVLGIWCPLGVVLRKLARALNGEHLIAEW